MHTYVGSRGSGLNFTVVYKDADTDKEVRYLVRLKDGQFQTDNDQIAAAIDEALAKNVTIRSRCKKADRSAAEKMAREHAEQMRNTGAQKGGVSSIMMKNAMSTEQQRRDTEIVAAGIDKVKTAEEESLVLSEPVYDPVVQEVKREVAETPEGSVLGEVGKPNPAPKLNLGASLAKKGV